MELTYEQWKQARKEIKRRMSISGWTVLIYDWIVSICVIGVMAAEVISKLAKGMILGNTVSIEKALLQSSQSAWGYILAMAIGLIILLLWKKTRFFRKEILAKGAPMKTGSFFVILCVFISGQMLFQILTTGLELGLNCFGYTITNGLESLQTSPDNFGMFLYAGILGPITEEILFRGVVQRSMLPFGKKLAILVSSLTFGLFHVNLIQMPYAFAVGLILGYVAAEYNIVWSMVLHVINNLVLGDLLYRLFGWLPMETANLIVWGIIMAFSVVAVILVIIKRADIKAWLQREHIIGAYAGCYFTCAGTIAMLIVMGISTVITTRSMITPL